MLPFILCAALQTSAPAGAPQTLPLTHSIDRVHVVPSRGGLTARGRTYKAGFDGRGATYVPFMGSDTPRDWPVRFELREVSAGESALRLLEGATPVHAHGAIEWDRGPVLERYLPELESLEQTFVLAERVEGPLTLQVRAMSDMVPGAEGDGLRFDAGGRGVTLSGAFAVDADGRRTGVAMTVTEDGYRIDVPAALVADSAFPLTIDPIIRTFGVDDFDVMLTNPSVAHDETSDAFYFVYEEQFSVQSSDVYGRLVTDTGSVIYDAYVWTAVGGRNVRPRVALVQPTRRALVVSTFDQGNLTDAEVVGRILNVPTLTLEPEIRIDRNVPAGPRFGVEVGASDWSPWFVAWTVDRAPGIRDSYTQYVRQGGTFPGTGSPRLGGSGPPDTFDVSLPKQSGPLLTGGNNTGFAVAVNVAAPLIPSVVVFEFTSTGGLRHVTQAGIGRHPKIASQLDDDGQRVYAVIAELGGTLVASIVGDGSASPLIDLTEAIGLAPGTTPVLDAVDTNGSSVVIAWTQTGPGGPRSIMSNVALLGTTATGLERIDLGSANDLAVTDLDAAGTVNAPGRYMLAAENRTLPGNTNPDGILYDDGTIAFGAAFCAPAELHSAGGRAEATVLDDPIAGAVVDFHAQSLPPQTFGIFAIGTDVASPVTPPGSAGRLCLGGEIARFQLAGQILNSGMDGEFTLGVDTGALPFNPVRSIERGQTLFVQAWFRDVGPNGPSSNFSSGAAVRFR